MRRTFAVIGFSFLLSTLCAIVFGVVAAYILFGIAVITAAVFIAAKPLRKYKGFIAAAISVIVALTLISVRYYCDEAPARALDNRKTHITATVLDYTATTGGYRYDLAVDADDDNPALRLKLLSRETLALDPGERMSADVKLTAKYCVREYDYANGEYLSAYISDTAAVEKLDSTHHNLTTIFSALRAKITESIRLNLDNDTASLLTAMLFSNKSGLDDTTRADFTACGLSHTMAVSGLHLSIICGALYLLLRRIKCRRGAAEAACIIIILLFTALTGFNFSCVRAAIVMIIYFAAHLLHRDADGINSLGLAALVMVAVNPYTACNVSFLLSLTATASMMTALEYILRRLEGNSPSTMRKIALTVTIPFIQSLCAGVAMLPLTALFFGSISLISPICNMLLLPVITLFLIIGIIFVLTIFIPFAPTLLGAALTALSSFIRALTHLFAQIPHAAAPLDKPETACLCAAILIIIAAAVIAYYHAPRRRIIAVASAICAVLILAASITHYAVWRDVTTITALDSGDGLCLVVKSGEDTAIIGLGGDSAHSFSEYDNAGKFGQISAILLKNSKMRYSQSAENVLKYIKPDTLYINKDEEIYPSLAKTAHNTAQYDDAHITLGNAEIHTFSEYAKITVGNFNMIITDATAAPPDSLSADVLLIAGYIHKFDNIAADTVIYSTNRTRLPKYADSTVYSTADNGNIAVITNGKNYKIKSE